MTEENIDIIMAITTEEYYTAWLQGFEAEPSSYAEQKPQGNTPKVATKKPGNVQKSPGDSASHSSDVRDTSVQQIPEVVVASGRNKEVGGKTPPVGCAGCIAGTR